MFLTKRQIIIHRIKLIATALAIVALYAAMVGEVILILNSI